MANKNTMKGILIAFEGPEGSGKSTHSKLLCTYLNGQGYNAIYVREPGGTVIGEAIRKILLSTKNKKINSICELLLYMANRAQIVDEVISPALKKGRIVISDRFRDATVAYQGYGAGIDLKLIETLNSIATKGISPDITILLDIATEAGLKRSKRKDRVEKKSVDFHKRVRKGYRALADKYPKRFRIISVKADIKTTQEKIKKEILRVI